MEEQCQLTQNEYKLQKLLQAKFTLYFNVFFKKKKREPAVRKRSTKNIFLKTS